MSAANMSQMAVRRMACAARGGMPARMQISGRSFIKVFFPRFCLLKPLRYLKASTLCGILESCKLSTSCGGTLPPAAQRGDSPLTTHPWVIFFFVSGASNGR